MTVVAGFTKQLVCQNDSASDLNWSSTDSTIVNVSTKGLLTAYKAGVATISVKSKAHAVSATCKVTVVDQRLTDVGVGADGSVFVIGSDSVSATGGYGIYKLVSNKLVKLPECAGIRIAVDPHGMPWVVNKSHLIFHYNGTLVWDQIPGTANDIGIGADGSVYAIGTQDVSPTGGYNIMKWNGSGWDNMPDCAGIHIAVDPHGTPWVVNRSNIVFQYGGTYLW
ncbi:MAG: Ig-like domain-containing protein, partial [Bacteroidetes bacterium]|nr:Ig-like domain-containing protein [Bacteroidota bacterium]